MADKRATPRVYGKYNATRVITLRMSEKQHASLVADSAALEMAINELLLDRVFPPGDALHGDHLPKPLTATPQATK